MSDLPSSRASFGSFDRRSLLRAAGLSVGATALAGLLSRDAKGEGGPGRVVAPESIPRAKAIIFLFMAGGPSQLDLFQDKPELRRYHGQTPPPSAMEGKRFAFLKGNETLLGSPRTFRRWGECGQEISDLLPEHRRLVDRVCWLHGMRTDVFNHGPAKILLNTGAPQPGRPSMGAWLSYGLGSEADDLPSFVVLQSGPRGPRGGSALWSSGFLPTGHQGVPLRSGTEPILHLASPAGRRRDDERRFVDLLNESNAERREATDDPEIATRIAAYEMAFRMQARAPELIDLSRESQQVLDDYGVEPGKPSYAANCLMARRLVERGVRFVQLYHTNWDHHGGPTENLEKHLPEVTREIDRPTVALLDDLERRGLLDETIVVWGGEFGRTPMGEVRESTGRDHHVDGYTMWAAGGGFRPGLIHGATDDLGLGTIADGKHVHDLQATLLHQLGIDHKKLTFRFQGRDFRLTDVHGTVVHELLT